MSRATFIRCAALLISSASLIHAAEKAVLRFTNDDSITGNLEQITATTLTWSAPWLQKPAAFDNKKVLELVIPNQASPPEADHVAVLQMKNGDTVRGQLQSITDDTINLDTWYAGPMAFNTLMVSSIIIEGTGPMLYRGPSSIDGWVQSQQQPAWKYERSAFTSSESGSIARDNMLPDECSISFKLQWKSDDLNFKVYLFSNLPTSRSPNSGYELSFRRTSAYLRKGDNRQYLGNTRIPEIAESQQVNIEIRASKRTGTLALFINGRLNEIWMDPNVKDGEFGSAIHFVAMNALPARVSEIHVKPWSGKIDRVPANGRRPLGPAGIQPGIDESENDDDRESQMKLANGDNIYGQVAEIIDGIATLNTSLGKIDLPVSRLRTLILKNLGQEESKLEPNDIRVSFSDGSSLVFRLDKIENGTIVGSSQNFGTHSEFGTASFDISTMSRIEFNIHDPRHKGIRSQDSW